MQDTYKRHIGSRYIGRSRRLALAGSMGVAVFVATLAGCNNGGTSGGGGATGSATVATVNGEAVGRDQLHTLLEATGGEAGVRELILRQMVMQEMKKQNITITDEEVDKRLKEEAAKQTGPGAEELQRAISTPGPRLDYFQNQIRTDMAVNRLITKDVKVDEAKLKEWFEKNKAKYGTPEQLKLGLLLSSTKVRADTMAAQLKSGTKTFAQLVEEQKKANDPFAAGSVTEMPEYLPSESLTQFGPAVATQIRNLKEGQNSGSLLLTPGGQKIYGIVRMADRKEAVRPDFAAMREVAEQDYKLEQVARQDLPPGQNFDQALKQVEGMVAQQNQGRTMQRPTYREMLNVMVQNAKQKLLTRLQGEVKVEVSDPMYAKVADTFKPQPTPGAPNISGAPSAGAPPAEGSAPPSGPAGNPAP